MLALILLCVTHSVLLYKLAASFSTFSIYLFCGKMVNLQEDYVNCPDIEHELQKMYLHHFLHYKDFIIQKHLQYDISLFIS